jgi:hypothetical protein
LPGSTLMEAAQVGYILTPTRPRLPGVRQNMGDVSGGGSIGWASTHDASKAGVGRSKPPPLPGSRAVGPDASRDSPTSVPGCPRLSRKRATHAWRVWRVGSRSLSACGHCTSTEPSTDGGPLRR